MNHSNDPGAIVAWNPDEKKTVVRALRSHEAGEEIHISYEALSNPMMVRQYGFTLPPETEPAWTVASKVRNLFEQKFSGPWDSLLGHITLFELHSAYITNSLGAAFQACALQGLNSEA